MLSQSKEKALGQKKGQVLTWGDESYLCCFTLDVSLFCKFLIEVFHHGNILLPTNEQNF